MAESKEKAKEKVNHFSKLALELFENIVKDVNPKDLLTIRATSRECAAKVAKVYAKEHFTGLLLHLHDDRSVEKCLAICKHPLLGPAVRTFTISIDPCDRGNKWLDDRLCTVEHRHSTRGPTTADPEPYEEFITRLQQDAEWHVIIELFTNMADACQVSALRIVGHERYQSTFAGGYHDFDLEGDPDWACAHAFAGIMYCLDRSNLHVDTLEIDKDARYAMPMCELWDYFDMFARVMSPVESLSLVLWRRHGTLPADAEMLNQLLAGLASSTTIRHLYIDCQSCENIDLATVFPIEDSGFPNLESLHLQGNDQLMFDVPVLVDFVTSHQRTLQRLELHSLCVEPNGLEDDGWDLMEEGVAKNIRRLTGLEDVTVDRDTEESWLDMMRQM